MSARALQEEEIELCSWFQTGKEERVKSSDWQRGRWEVLGCVTSAGRTSKKRIRRVSRKSRSSISTFNGRQRDKLNSSPTRHAPKKLEKKPRKLRWPALNPISSREEGSMEGWRRVGGECRQELGRRKEVLDREGGESEGVTPGVHFLFN